MELKYHQPLFDLLGLTPTLDPTAEAKIVAVEQAYGVVLPPSVREWYSLKSVYSIVEERVPFLVTVTLEAMMKAANEWVTENSWDGEILPPYPYPTIPFAWDDHGIVLLVIGINKFGEPVILSYARNHNNDHLEFREWYERHASSSIFSTEIFDMVWWELFQYQNGSAFSYEEPIDANIYEIVKVSFNEIPSISNIRIFRYEDQTIYIRESDDKIQCWLYADTTISFKNLLETVKPIGTLSKTLQFRGRGDEYQDIFDLFQPPRWKQILTERKRNQEK